MEGYKDLKIHLNINVRLTMEKPNLQPSIGTLGSLRLNNMKHNPAVMSGIQTLFMVFLFVFLGNLVNHWIEDFQSDDDLSDYVVWIYAEIVYLMLRIFLPTLVIYQNQGCRQFMKSAVSELASEFRCLQSSRLSHTQSTNTLLTLETTQGHISHEEATYRLDELNKIEDRTEEQEDAKSLQTVVLNTVNIELQEATNKPDLKNIKEEIEIESGVAQEMQSVIKGKGKGKGKGQSNFKEAKVLSPKHMSDDKPEGIKEKSRYKEEENKLTRSALASRRALKKWKERTKKLQVLKPRLTQ